MIFIFLVGRATASDVCPRPGTGSTVTTPPEITSSDGHLRVSFSFRSQEDDFGLTRFCYMTAANAESPTLRVWPGDEVVLDVANELVAQPAGHQHISNPCSTGPMTAASTNLHFHGLAIPPSCHQDDVIHTLIQPADKPFQYRFQIPKDHPPGLYWYHPHPHGYSESQVLGGASGALIVEGIDAVKPEVAGLPERLLVLRDQPLIGSRTATGDPDDVTGKDISINFVPVMYPLYMPAALRVKPDRKEFWRVLNASADTYFDLQIVTVQNGQRVAQSLRLIAMDGTPVSAEVSAAPRTGIHLSPGARAEFIVTTPPAGGFSQLISRKYDTGPDGASTPERVIANIISGNNMPEANSSVPITTKHEWHFTSLRNLKPARTRTLFFSEDREDLRTPGKPPKYFITLDKKPPAVFDMNFKQPDITVQQGTVEDWIIENRARETHVFHIHQLHFQLLARDGVDASEPMLLDTVDLPYWDGKSAQYPRVRLRMDFRAAEIVGTFLFHCHILEHEDAGMMGSIEVLRHP